MNRLKNYYQWSDLPRMVALATAYSLLARMVLTFSTANGNVTIFWIPGGLALAALLLRGKRLWPAVFIGALAAGLMVDDPFWTSVFLALGNTLESLAAAALLLRMPNFDTALTRTSDLAKMALVGAICSIISALVGPLTLLVSGYLNVQTVSNNIWHWWQADTLGILLGTPLLLVWRQWPHVWFSRQRIFATFCFWLLAFLTGQMVFLDWFHGSFGITPKGFWMILFVVWGALGYGRHGVLLIISMVAIQALQGAAQGIGYFGSDIVETGLQNLWVFLLILTLTGMMLALSICQRNQIHSALIEKEHLLSESQRLAQIGSWSWESDTGKIIWSEETYRIYGVSPPDFDPTPENLLGCIHPEDRLLVQQWLDDYLADKHPAGIEFRNLRPDGEIRHLYGQGDVLPASQWLPYRALGTVQDITERKQAEAALKKSERMLKAVFESSQDGIAVADAETLRYAYFNEALCRMLGYCKEEISNLTILDLHHADDLPNIAAVIEQLKRGEVGLIPELPFKRKDGSTVFVENSASTVMLAGRLYVMGVFRDITERKQQEERLRLTARVFETTLESIMITDATGGIIDVNDAFIHITGYPRQEVLGKNPRFLKSGRQDVTFYAAMWQAIADTGHWSGELWNRRKDGSVYPVWSTISAITNDKGVVTHYVGISSDITLLKQHEKQLEQIAHYDALTGIPNRVLLGDRMQQALAQTRREQKLLAVCYLDLDGFKPINDGHGHDVGDRVLIEIAGRIGSSLRGGDTVARLGGDEFVILLMGIDNADACNISLERLLQSIGQPITIQGLTVSVTASIGVALYPLDDEDPDTLLRHADQAMYLAKQQGKNRYHIFDPSEDARIRINHEQRARIEQGLLANEFELYYQPKVALDSHRVVGTEALIRWHHPERGLLPPADFLPLIENSDLEIRVGTWVIGTALAQMDCWHHEGLDLDVSVNIDAAHLQNADFVETLRQKLSLHPVVQPHQLQIEILETAALADISKVGKIIEDCVALGVRFALDDFGTGYSSLSYLRRLPADTLKIDQSFVRDMLIDQGDMAIVEGIIALAHTFKRTTVAEGVETPEHFQTLRQMGCDIGQGYGIARPMPAGEVLAWCRTFSGVQL